MNRDQRLDRNVCAPGSEQGGFRRLGLQNAGLGVDVGEHGYAPKLAYGGDHRGGRVRWRDDAISRSQLRHAQRQPQRIRTVADGDCRVRAEIGRELLLEPAALLAHNIAPARNHARDRGADLVEISASLALQIEEGNQAHQ
jgi:hypothetical protein